MPPTTRSKTRWSPHKLVVLLVLIPALVALPIWAFSWAAATSQPNDLPIGVAGPASATGPIKERLAQQPDAFDVHTYDSAAEARTAIEDRDVYGAVAATPDGLQVMTASAASPTVAQMLTETFGSSEAAGGPPPTTVTDLVPTDSDDPHGAALGASILPLVIVSALSGVIVLVLSRPGWQQVGGVTTSAVLGGLVVVGIVQGWLSALGGDWVVNAGAVALTIGAIAASVVGFTAAFGRVGLGLTILAMMFVGNPWSGMMSAPELMPEPAGAIGQLLPPGAGGNLLRSTAFFDGAGAMPYVLVLSAWAVLGLCGIAVGAMRRRRVDRELADAVRPVLAAAER